MWFERGVRLGVITALIMILIGLLVLALPEAREGPQLIRLTKVNGLRVADLVGATLIGMGTVLTWATVLAWQRARIHE